MYYEPHSWMSDESYDTRPDTMGGFWDSLINAGVQTGANIGVGWLQNRQQPSGRNCLQGQVSGDEAMTNCVPRVMALFDELETMAIQMSPLEVINQANAIARVFSDNLYFDQSIGGRSRTIREEAQAAGRQRADQIIAWANQAIAAQQQAAIDPTAAVTAVTVGGLEIDTQTVLIAGGGLLLLLFLMKS